MTLICTKRLVLLGTRLSDPEDAELRRVSAALGVSRSEFARDAVEVYRLLALAVVRANCERPPSAERVRSILTGVAGRLDGRSLRATRHERSPE